MWNIRKTLTNKRKNVKELEISREQIILQIEKEQSENQNAKQTKTNKIKKVVSKDIFDSLVIFIKFLMTIFPTAFGLMDFCLDVYYVFFSRKFYNTKIEHTAWFCFALAPLISLIAWLLLFSQDLRSKKCKGFTDMKKKHNTAKLEKKSILANCYMVSAYLLQFGYEVKNITKHLLKGLFFTFLQQLKVLIFYITMCSGYKPEYLITDTILSEFETNQKILKKNHGLYLKNEEIKKENEEILIHNDLEKKKYEDSQNEIKEIQSSKEDSYEKYIKIQEALYIPKYRKEKEEHTEIEITKPQKQVLLESGIRNKSHIKGFSCFLDLNLMENIQNEAVLKSFMLIGDLIESAFESLPMLILQFINNSLTNWEFWDQVSFASSTIMVVYSSIKIVSMLFDYKLNSAYGIFSLLTTKSESESTPVNTNIIPEKMEEKYIEQLGQKSFKNWICTQNKNEQIRISKDPLWFIGDFDRSSLKIGNIEELQIVSKWDEDQFSKYSDIVFDFANEKESINLITTKKFKEMFDVIAQHTAENNTISFNFYETPLSPEDKTEIYSFFKDSKLCGYLFEEQFENVEMESQIVRQIVTQFQDGGTPLRNIKLVFNEKNNIEYSGYEQIDSNLIDKLVLILNRNVSFINTHLQIENYQLSKEQTKILFQDNEVLPEQLKYFSVNCQSIQEEFLERFTNLPSLETLQIIYQYGKIENINSKFLQNVPKLKVLELDFSRNWIKDINGLVQQLIVKKHLENINLNFKGNQIENIDLIGELINSNTKLTNLNVNLERNQVTNLDKFWDGISSNNKLTNFNMDLSNNKISNIDKFGDAIATNNKLAYFNMNLESNQIRNFDKLGDAIATNNTLSSFNMKLGWNKICDLDKLGDGISRNKKLTSFNMDLSGNKISNLDQLGNGIATNNKLTSFSMNLRRNKISNLDKFWGGISTNNQLTSFEMDLQDNKISNLDKFGDAISTNNNITSFTMNLWYNQISNLDKFGDGIATNHKLTNFNMNLQGNYINNLDNFGDGISSNNKLTSFNMDLRKNKIINLDKFGDAFATNNTLTSFNMNLQENQISNLDKFGNGIATNNTLTSFNMNLESNQISNFDKFGNGISTNNKLTSFEMNLWANQIRNLDKFGDGISTNNKLTSFKMNLGGNQISNFDQFGNGISTNNTLTSFNMNLEENQINNFDKFGNGISTNNKLTSFKMNLGGNQIRNLDKFGDGIAKNNTLTSFNMKISRNKISNFDKLGDGITNNNKLTSFEMDLWANQIRNLDKFGDGIAKNNTLTNCIMRLGDNRISDLRKLGDAIATNKKLTSIQMDLQSNQIRNLDKIYDVFATNNTLTSFYMDLNKNEMSYSCQNELEQKIKRIDSQIQFEYQIHL